MSNKKRVRFEIYKPKKKIKISKEKTVPFLVRIGAYFVGLGGFFTVAVSSIYVSVKSFFNVKQKVYNTSLLKKKYVEVRIKRKDGK